MTSLAVPRSFDRVVMTNCDGWAGVAFEGKLKKKKVYM